ncbi:hypothetical protein [Pseudolactococcus carnosus]|uniref:hypothetical protein n=1 Tax=Pseudolactococcus carnosus TaxID=2749961 RepID=UPI0008122C63|nr:hypothetical protein [Lactococcus carnosus]QDJ26333.1 hypothetical protein BHS00_07105 [Lactococcus carnosus]SCA91569.1 hypothetical protein LP2241_20339 [Lactococcus piscium]
MSNEITTEVLAKAIDTTKKTVQNKNDGDIIKITGLPGQYQLMVAYWDKSSYQTPERRRANFKVIDDKSKMSCHKSVGVFLLS